MNIPVFKKKKKSPSQMRREAQRKLEKEQKDHLEDTVKVTDDSYRFKDEDVFDIKEAPLAACSTASSREEQEIWKTLCSKCWTNFTTCPD